MDDATLNQYRTLLSWIGERSGGLGPLLLEFPEPAALICASNERLAALPNPTQAAVAEARAAWPRPRPLPPWKDAGREEGDLFLPIVDSRYPASLRHAPDAPPWLFCRGSVKALTRPAVAVVGSRRASRAGRRVAETLGRELAGRGYLVCSGLALGIDGEAHEGALQAGSTAAVLASGLDLASPRQNLGLARRITESGCLLSELPYGTAPHRSRFPRRNRIISGLCMATIVVEAALPSGSLHTAAAALEQGRDVYVLPWSLFHEQGRGCLRLLRDGAIPLTELAELDGYFPPLEGSKPGAAAPASGTVPRSTLPPALRTLSKVEQRVLELLGEEALTPEAIGAALEISLLSLIPVLSLLELGGHLERCDGGYQRAQA
ncbi:MAG: DNA-processing protein DprA [Pseudomonadota bacterium]